MSIPDKIFFKIGEVAEFVGVKPYVLRYWETEFSLVLQKSASGQRLYRRKDIDRLLLIKRLLYSEGFTIAGARKSLSRRGKMAPGSASEDERATALSKGRQEMPAAPETTRGSSSSTVLSREGKGIETGSAGDPDWIRALRREVDEMQALIRSAREFEV